MTDDVKIWAVVLTNGGKLKGEKIEFSSDLGYETPKGMPDHLVLHSGDKVCIVPWSSVLYLSQEPAAKPVNVST